MKLMFICMIFYEMLLILNLMEIFINHVRLLGHIISNQTLKTTNRWLTGYH